MEQKEQGLVGKPRVAPDVFKREATNIIASIDRSISALAKENVPSKLFTDSLFSSELTIVVDNVGNWELETDFTN